MTYDNHFLIEEILDVFIMMHSCIVQCPFCKTLNSVHRAVQVCFDN